MDKDLKGWLLRIAWIFGLIVVLTVHLNLWIQGSEAFVIVASVINFLVEGGILAYTAKPVFKHDFSTIPGYRDPKGEQKEDVK